MEAIELRLKHFKNTGTKIIWTIHNIVPHESNDDSDDSKIFRLFVSYTDFFIHHGEESIRQIKSKFIEAKEGIHLVCPHGDYLIQFNHIEKNIARKRLNLPSNKTILLSFGFIRGYKGMGVLKKVFSKWNKSDKYLFVAGEVVSNNLLDKFFFKIWKGKFRRRSRKSGYDIDKIKNEDVSLYFSAADFVIATHTRGLNTGLIPMAMTFNTPILYPDIGNFKEQAKGGVGVAYVCNDINDALRGMDELDQISTIILNNQRWLEMNSWDRHVSIILSNV